MFTFNIYVHFTQISQTVQLKLMLYDYGTKLCCYTMTRFCEINEMNLKIAGKNVVIFHGLGLGSISDSQLCKKKTFEIVLVYCFVLFFYK